MSEHPSDSWAAPAELDQAFVRQMGRSSYRDGVDRVFIRRAARVICLDRRNRVLLLHWRDPGSGKMLWEPPGGGVEPGESEPEAARRELREETGLSCALDDSWAIEVDRDFVWNMKHFVGPERFFGCQIDGAVPVHPAALTESETGALVGFGWFSTAEMEGLEDRLEPPDLPSVVASLLDIHRGRR
jgi:8-oxo-dGTP pyrophosphatase MutT (NUDIX family)